MLSVNIEIIKQALMKKKLFASLLFAVFSFTTSAQVTHIISRGDPNTIIAYPIGWSTDTRTLNVTASVGDTLRFVDTHIYSTLVIFRKSPSSNFVISDWSLQAGGYPTSIPYDYVVSVNDTAYVFSKLALMALITCMAKSQYQLLLV